MSCVGDQPNDLEFTTLTEDQYQRLRHCYEDQPNAYEDIFIDDDVIEEDEIGTDSES